ncbi:MAG: hypothetical protein SOI44_05345 [Lactimicrobium sp.]|uniref:hypothetical protein n=1 Tax=Lactimicrobium sp. TaxID=2563780 RepID=UPI002F3532D8
MRYGYAVLDNDEVFETSSKLFFTKVIDLDDIFLDVGSSRVQMQKMLGLLSWADTLMMQGYDSSGLSVSEMKELLAKLHDLGVTVLFAQKKGAVVPGEEKKRGRKSKELDMALFSQLCDQLARREITKKEMAAALGITYATLQKHLVENGLVQGSADQEA